MKWADTISYVGLAFVAGWISCQSYYGLSHLWEQRNTLAQVAAQAACDMARAREVAGQAIEANKNLYVPSPSFSRLKPCPKVTPTSIPSVAKVLK